MASLSAAPSFTGAKSAMRHTEPSGTFARPRIAPLRRGAFVSRRTAGTTRAAAGGYDLAGKDALVEISCDGLAPHPSAQSSSS